MQKTKPLRQFIIEKQPALYYVKGELDAGVSENALYVGSMVAGIPEPDQSWHIYLSANFCNS